MMPSEYYACDLWIVARLHSDGYHNAADTDFIDRTALYRVVLPNVENAGSNFFQDSGHGGRLIG